MAKKNIGPAAPKAGAAMKAAHKNQIHQPSVKKPAHAAREKGPERFIPWFVVGGILLIFFMIYGQSLSFSLIDWDDYGYIKNNKDVHDFNLVQFFTSFYGGNYHPLTCITWAIDYQIGELNGKSYHFTNILFHALNVVLVWLFIKRLSGRAELGFFAAAVFAFHPMHVESVAWVSERKDVLYAFFFLLSLIAYLRFLEKEEMKFYLISMVFFLLSLLSKSAAVILPLVLFLVDYFRERKITGATLLQKVPFFILSIIFGLVALKSQQTAMDYGFAPHFTMADRLFIAAYGITHYLVSFIFPVKQAALHPYPVAAGEILPWYFYASAIIPLIMVAAVVFVKRYRPVLLFALGFYIVNLLLVIQFLPVGKAVVADRYTYLPYIGLSFLTGYLIFNAKPPMKQVLAGVALAWLVILAVTTYRRLPVWKDSYALFSDIIEKYPAEESGYYNRGLVLYYTKDYKAAKADFDEAIRLKPANAPALYNRSLVRMQFQDYQGILDDLNKALALEPDYIDARKNRGIAKAIYRDYEGALQDFSYVLDRQPGDTSALVNRGLTWINMNDRDKACTDFRKAAGLGSVRASGFLNQYCK